MTVFAHHKMQAHISAPDVFVSKRKTKRLTSYLARVATPVVARSTQLHESSPFLPPSLELSLTKLGVVYKGFVGKEQCFRYSADVPT